MKALAFANDFIRDGVPIWWDESPDVFFEVEKRVSRSAAALQRAEASESGPNKEAPKGRYYVPVPKTRGGAAMPTFADWLVERAKHKSADKTRK